MKLSRLTAALVLSAALFAAGCQSACRRTGCCATTASAPPCGCNGPAAPVPVPASAYPPNAVVTPPPGATIIHQ